MRTIVQVFVALLAITACSSRRTTKTSDNANVNSWSTVHIGSVYETKTVTRLEKPFVHETETTTKQTLIARNETEASIKIEIAEGTALSAQDVKVSLHQDAELAHTGSKVTTASDTCTVPAGTFDCTRTTVEVRDGDVTRSTVTWTAKKIPVPVKSVVTNENMTVTTELTKIAAGG